jgi:hypothetical protein
MAIHNGAFASSQKILADTMQTNSNSGCFSLDTPKRRVEKDGTALRTSSVFPVIAQR